MRFFWVLLVLTAALRASDVAVAPASLTFAYQFNSQVLPSQAIAITGPQALPFTVSRPLDQNWLILPSGTPSFSATTPAVLPVAIDPGKLLGTYSTVITLRFPDGTIIVPVTLAIGPTPVLAASPATVIFDASTLALPSQGFVAGVSNGAALATSASTTTPWLTVQGSNSFVLTANRALAGTHLTAGSVQVRGSPLLPVANNPLNVPVLYFGNGLGSRGPLTIDAPSLTFSGAGSQIVSVTGGEFSALSDAKWLSTATSNQSLTVIANPGGLPPGTYQATVILSSSGVLQMLPVSLSTVAPQLTKVVNAASYAEGAISPGEVVTLGGIGLGPANLAGLALDPSGRVSNILAGVQVLFNGVAAPLVYVSATQVAAVAPYDLDGKSTAAVQVVFNGVVSNIVTVPVVASAPGIFTANASGKGPAAVLRTGDILSIYMTGEGQTTPAGENGKVTGTPPLPRLPVTATIDGEAAEVQFAGEAPGIVSGVMQVNLRIPASARSGDLPLVVSVGGVPSQTGVTVSVR